MPEIRKAKVMLYCHGCEQRTEAVIEVPQGYCFDPGEHFCGGKLVVETATFDAPYALP